MGKFKVGDRVKSLTGDKEYIGVIGTIIDDDGSFVQYKIQLDKPVERWGDRTIWRSEDGLELVTWQPKVGDRVHYKDLYVEGDGVINSKNGDGDRSLHWFVEVDEKDRELAYFISDTCRKFATTSLSPLPVAAEAQPLAAWVPAVGDRVRFVEKYAHAKVGDEGIITGLWDDGVEVEANGQMYSCFTGRVEPVEVAAPLTITAGKFYKTRDGRKVGPAERDVDHYYAKDGFVWRVGNSTYSDSGACGWIEDVKDLIAEWVDEPVVANDNGSFASLIGKTFTAKVRIPNQPAIVALIENGQPKPSERPVVHVDKAMATTEAARLAIKHPGQRFGVFVLADSKIADEVITKTAVLRAA
ncbi:hypothetical protein [Rhizobium leucaenae]|uniref:hypothetical protein n=1 Tax=Rhizobium leucaenae TaxID=29450 RepID=UPI0007EE5EF3|nr:hypothetical protein [Rhizobium leucaenae]